MEFAVNEVELEVRFAGDVKKVWKALTEDISAWWPKSFSIGPSKRFVMEPKVGGRMYEDWGNNQGLLWATVISLKEPEVLQLAGDLFTDYGGPGRSHTSYKLTADGDSTVLRFTETTYGRIREKTGKSLDDGWNYLLAKCLKAFVEGNELPEDPIGKPASEPALA